MAAFLLAACGSANAPQPSLVDGSTPADVPVTLSEVDNAVMTRTTVVPARGLDAAALHACGLPPDLRDAARVVERVGVNGSSLTVRVGRSTVYGCDRIPDPADDPDRPYGGLWCDVSLGRLVGRALTDPRLGLCTDGHGDQTAFVWVQPLPGAAWIVVSDPGMREIYESALGLPVRVTTTDDVHRTGSASFDIEEYRANGSRVRAYTLDAAVAG